MYARQSETPLSLALSPDQKQIAIGRYDGVVVLLDEATGKALGQPLPIKPRPPVLPMTSSTDAVRRFPVIRELEPNDSPKTGQIITLPATLVGAIDKAGDLDWFRFDLKQGQEVGVQVMTATVGSKLDSVLRLVDPDGVTIAESLTGLMGHTCTRSGTYSLGIRDREYRGGPNMHYRLHVGDIPIVTSVFPLGLQRGTEADIQIEGVHLGKPRLVRSEGSRQRGGGLATTAARDDKGGAASGCAVAHCW